MARLFWCGLYSLAAVICAMTSALVALACAIVDFCVAVAAAATRPPTDTGWASEVSFATVLESRDRQYRGRRLQRSTESTAFGFARPLAA